MAIKRMSTWMINESNVDIQWVWWEDRREQKNVIYFFDVDGGTGDNALLSLFHCNSVKAIFVLWMRDPDQSFWGKVSLIQYLNMRRKLHLADVGHWCGCITVVWGQIICTFSFLLYVNNLYSCLKPLYHPPSIYLSIIFFTQLLTNSFY